MKYILSLLIIALTFSSCRKDELSEYELKVNPYENPSEYYVTVQSSRDISSTQIGVEVKFHRNRLPDNIEKDFIYLLTVVVDANGKEYLKGIGKSFSIKRTNSGPVLIKAGVYDRRTGKTSALHEFIHE